jgi:outer membrane lipoprotein LolB
MMRIVFSAVFLLLLTACTGALHRGSTPPDQGLWQRHQQQVDKIHQWDIRGRVAFRTEDNGGQADLFWRQQEDKVYDIKLVAPFGGGTSLIQGRQDGVMLVTSNGEQLFETDIDSLLARFDDIHFPVSGLRYWIRGIPSPDSKVRLLRWNEQGQLHRLEQDGWQVEIRNYRNVGDYRLPVKLFIKRGEEEQVDVRLVIRQWGLP